LSAQPFYDRNVKVLYRRDAMKYADKEMEILRFSIHGNLSSPDLAQSTAVVTVDGKEREWLRRLVFSSGMVGRPCLRIGITPLSELDPTAGIERDIVDCLERLFHDPEAALLESLASLPRVKASTMPLGDEIFRLSFYLGDEHGPPFNPLCVLWKGQHVPWLKHVKATYTRGEPPRMSYVLIEKADRGAAKDDPLVIAQLSEMETAGVLIRNAEPDGHLSEF
jgi:hypothetical protein